MGMVYTIVVYPSWCSVPWWHMDSPLWYWIALWNVRIMLHSDLVQNFYGRNSDLTEELLHGTSVSGSITANTNNGVGIAGICWTCKIMCLRVGRTTLSIGAFVEVNEGPDKLERIFTLLSGCELCQRLECPYTQFQCWRRRLTDGTARYWFC